MELENLLLPEKTKELEYAALNLSPKEISEICGRVGHLEYSARALGIACRFRGIECVRALVEGGASFHAELTNYMVMTYDSYGDDLSVMLLDKIPEKTISYLAIAPKYAKSVKQENGNILKPVSFEERIEILDYLFENREMAEFNLGELLYIRLSLKSIA